ncbi:MAG: hypothetical protein FJ280_15915 [Planctomycetes bacterium]|nr:hypothetical protein [Planctomycetota bacterium]
MQWIVVRQTQDSGADGTTGLLRYALSTAPLQGVLLDGLDYWGGCYRNRALAERTGWTLPQASLWVLPRSWQAGLVAVPAQTVFYEDTRCLEARDRENPCASPWVVITNGRFAAHANPSLVQQLLDVTKADGVAVTAASDWLACRERLRMTRDRRLVGYRRLYADSMSPMPIPVDWPHYLFVRREAFDTVLQSGLLSSFSAWTEKARALGLELQAMAVAGSACDLESEEGLLAVTRVALDRASGPGRSWARIEERTPLAEADGISPRARLIGPVVCGRQVGIEAGALVVGPTVLCEGSRIGSDAFVDSAVVGAGASVAPNQSLVGRVVRETARPPAAELSALSPNGTAPSRLGSHPAGVFRTWPRFSYAQCFKRIADVVAAVIVLVLFAPILPVIALAVKLSSSGPVFFQDKRQGLRGRPFRCMKFRTMRQGADKIQDKLRFVCEVDGPQFKMADDPRITTVGRFLRETYLDEIPQFFNVLCGQMSVVGPRPSPESENTLCPSWRDARLSVRPGITGLWQIYRTREPQKDFQEWIHYDTRYVRDFSFGLDLWICWRTFRKMVANFVRQF